MRDTKAALIDAAITTLRESGFAELLPTLSDDAVYVGISGGSMAVTSSFGETYNDRVVATTGSETPLGLIDIA